MLGNSSTDKAGSLARQTQCNDESITIPVVDGRMLVVSNDGGDSLSLMLYTSQGKRENKALRLNEITRTYLRSILKEFKNLLSKLIEEMKDGRQKVAVLCLKIKTSIGILKISDKRQINRLNKWLNSPA